MSRLPDFFIVGAGKSGTTSLYDVLKFHPSLFLPAIKEPGYFNNKSFNYGGGISSFKDYIKLFDDAADDQIIGDGSTSYFICNEAANRIYSKNPDAKIIIILRDPVTRAFSDYLMIKRMSRISKIQIGDSFKEEIINESKRIKERDFSGPFCLLTSLYFRNIIKFTKLFDPQNILFLYTSQLKEKPEKLYEDICNFLCVDFTLLDQNLFQTKRNYYYEKRFGDIDKIIYKPKPAFKKAANFLIPSQMSRAKLKYFLKRLNSRKARKPDFPEESYSAIIPLLLPDMINLRQIIGNNVNVLCKDWPQEYKNIF